jgi:hypothetical protein
MDGIRKDAVSFEETGRQLERICARNSQLQYRGFNPETGCYEISAPNPAEPNGGRSTLYVGRQSLGRNNGEPSYWLHDRPTLSFA